MKKRLTDRERGLWWGERESKALRWLNPVNGGLDTKLTVMKGSWDLAMMSKQKCVELAGGCNRFGSVDLFAHHLASWCFGI